eukprot:2529696-Prymnesium_polylepis.2
MHAHRVPHDARHRRRPRQGVLLDRAPSHPAEAQALLQLAWLHLQQPRAQLELRHVDHRRRLAITLRPRCQLQAAQLQHQCHHAEQLLALRLAEAERQQCCCHLAKAVVVLGRARHSAALLAEDRVVLPRARQPPRRTHHARRLQQHVEHVVVALAARVRLDTWLLQQVHRRERAENAAAVRVDLDVKVLPKARAVVVAHRRRVAERLHHRVALHQPRREAARLAAPAVVADRREERQADLHRLRLARARLARDHHRLIDRRSVIRARSALTRAVPRARRQCVVVRARDQAHARPHAPRRLERVDADGDVAHVRVDHAAHEARIQALQQRRLRQLGQVEHVVVEREHILRATAVRVRGRQPQEEAVRQRLLRLAHVDRHPLRHPDRSLERCARVHRRCVPCCHLRRMHRHVQLPACRLQQRLVKRLALGTPGVHRRVQLVAALHEALDALGLRLGRQLAVHHASAARLGFGGRSAQRTVSLRLRRRLPCRLRLHIACRLRRLRRLRLRRLRRRLRRPVSYTHLRAHETLMNL